MSGSQSPAHDAAPPVLVPPPMPLTASSVTSSLPSRQLDSIAEDLENLGETVVESVQALSDRIDTNDLEAKAWREDMSNKLNQLLEQIGHMQSLQVDSKMADVWGK